MQEFYNDENKMEFELKTGPQGHVYLPKKIRDIFGDKMNLLPNATAAVIYPENADPRDVIKSVQVIISDLKLRAENAATVRRKKRKQAQASS